MCRKRRVYTFDCTRTRVRSSVCRANAVGPCTSGTRAHELSSRSMSGSIPATSKSFLVRAGPMATCCYRRCASVFDAVRYCPACEASFAVCVSHQGTKLQCPWLTLSGSPCLARVPICIDQQRWRAPLTCGPMYVRPSSQGTDQPLALHLYMDPEHSAMPSAQPRVNTDVRHERGTATDALHRQAEAKKHAASV